MSDLGYSRCGSRRGFRVYPIKRFSVKTLRTRFVYLVGLLSRWRRAYGRAFRALRRGICRENNAASVLRRSRRDSRFSSSSRKPLVREMNYMQSNSFYSEAIKDCLEFIKRNSVSAEQRQQLLEEGRDRLPLEYDGPGNWDKSFHDDMPSNTILLSKIV
ncbi:hypothetical protein CDL15_Pgr004832 [Punica granatum]|uniref:Uncharacterized protein n=1 Tax=Punica granatum TaxID=22663 RepID=A0A218W7Q6_PUNGR|nr:hypothetical protein CDL15_Pgr004832 [Punica granatum]PKI57071.1 hypothetical protein CRG98_022575 [Punica granatum]